MESIYYVMSWLCHRTCRHCYEERFRPYQGEALREVVDSAAVASPRIIDHFPASMLYTDDEGVNRRGRIILAGGEILLEPVRERVLYPALAQLRARYGGDVKLIIQTTGDVLTSRIVDELLERNVWMISVSGIDSFHQGLEEPAAQEAMVEKLTGLFTGAGLTAFSEIAAHTGDAADEGRYFQFFGAQPGTWIGALWPRGRAWRHSLTTATLSDNFCNRWSGGLHFLRYGRQGAEVSVDPEGNVFPCCVKTRRPIGNLLEEPLEAMLARAAKSPVYQAISAGRPERMGLEHGWPEERFLAESRTTLPDGRTYQNLCIGCDAFHDAVLGDGLVRLV